MRWGAEEAYKCDKLRLELENFSGLSVRVVLQDCFAKLFTVNLTAICAWVAQARKPEKRQPHSSATPRRAPMPQAAPTARKRNAWVASPRIWRSRLRAH